MATSVILKQSFGPEDLSVSMVDSLPDEGGSITHLLAWLGHSRGTGVVEVHHPDGTASHLHVISGVLQVIMSAHWDAGVDLADRLVESGDLQPEDLDSVFEEVHRTKAHISLVLFKRRLLGAPEIARMLRRGRMGFLERLCSPGELRVAFEDRDEGLRKDPAPLDLIEALVFLYRRALDRYTLHDLGPLLEPYQRLYPATSDRVKDLFGGKDLEFVTEQCDGNSSIRILLKNANISNHQAGRLLMLLLSFGLCALRETPLSIDPNADIRVALVERLRGIRSGNWFDILGVHWTTHADEIERKHAEEMNRYRAYADRKGLDQELRDQIHLVLKKVDEAHAILSKSESRSAYRKEFYTERQHEFSAEFLFQQSELHQLKNNYKMARRLLECSIELSSNAKYSQALRNLKWKA